MTMLTDAERAANRWEIWSEKYPNSKWWDAASEEDAQQECARLNSGFGNARPFYIRRFNLVELSPAATPEQGIPAATQGKRLEIGPPVSAPVSTPPAPDTAALVADWEAAVEYSTGDIYSIIAKGDRLAAALRAEQERFNHADIAAKDLAGLYIEQGEELRAEQEKGKEWNAAMLYVSHREDVSIFYPDGTLKNLSARILSLEEAVQRETRAKVAAEYLELQQRLAAFEALARRASRETEGYASRKHRSPETDIIDQLAALAPERR